MTEVETAQATLWYVPRDLDTLQCCCWVSYEEGVEVNRRALLDAFAYLDHETTNADLLHEVRSKFHIDVSALLDCHRRAEWPKCFENIRAVDMLHITNHKRV